MAILCVDPLPAGGRVRAGVEQSSQLRTYRTARLMRFGNRLSTIHESLMDSSDYG